MGVYFLWMGFSVVFCFIFQRFFNCFFQTSNAFVQPNNQKYVTEKVGAGFSNYNKSSNHLLRYPGFGDCVSSQPIILSQKKKQASADTKVRKKIKDKYRRDGASVRCLIRVRNDYLRICRRQIVKSGIFCQITSRVVKFWKCTNFRRFSRKTSWVLNILKVKIHQIQGLSSNILLQMLLIRFKCQNLKNSLFYDMQYILRWMLVPGPKIIMDNFVWCTFVQWIISFLNKQ